MIKTNTLELHELEHINLKTITVDGKRYYTAEGEEDSVRYPSVTTVTGLHSKKQIKLWRKRVGEKKANKITKQATKRGTSFHQYIEDYLRKEKEYIEFDNVLQEGMFKAVQPVLDEIVPIALEAPLYSNQLQMAGRVDCVAEFDGKLSIIDFKGSTKRKSPSKIGNYFCQATAYSIMWQEMMGENIDQVVILISSKRRIHGETMVYSNDSVCSYGRRTNR